jgi:hypothetical protein
MHTYSTARPCAVFCYMVVWCIWAYLNNTDMKTDEMSCGLNNIASTVTLTLGGAFACLIIAWLACIAQAVLFVLGRNDVGGGAAHKV